MINTDTNQTDKCVEGEGMSGSRFRELPGGVRQCGAGRRSPRSRRLKL